jgi:hypothetical protein
MQHNTIFKPLVGTHQSVAYTASAGTSNAVGSQAYAVRVMATSDAYIYMDAAGTAATSSIGWYLPASKPEVFKINPGWKISAVQVSAGGSLDIVEVE